MSSEADKTNFLLFFFSWPHIFGSAALLCWVYSPKLGNFPHFVAELGEYTQLFGEIE
jgi:hypothetical protein